MSILLHSFLTRLIASFILFFTFSAAYSQSKYTLEKDIAYYEKSSDDYVNSRCKLDIYYPKDTKNWSTVVWFHGGGLTGGNKHIPEGLMEKGVAIVTVNYRLYPNVKAPEYIRDAAKAVAWTIKNIEKYGGSSKLIFVSGHSAGGYLASMVGLDKKYLAEWGEDPDNLAGLIPVSGHTITHFTVREERGIPGTQPVVDELAPLYHVRKDAPPLILITGDRELEMLGRYEENAYLMRMMKVVGHEKTELFELQGYGHGNVYPAMPIVLRYINKLSKEID